MKRYTTVYRNALPHPLDINGDEIGLRQGTGAAHLQ